MHMSPEQRIRLHTWLAWLWAALTVVTTAAAVFWPGHPLLMAWLIFISCYAIVSTHWAAKEGAAPSAKEG
jgi:fatty acid desaturase